MEKKSTWHGEKRLKGVIYNVNQLTASTVTVLELSTVRHNSRALYSRSEIRGAFGSESSWAGNECNNWEHIY
jgi:hypothetical protein